MMFSPQRRLQASEEPSCIGRGWRNLGEWKGKGQQCECPCLYDLRRKEFVPWPGWVGVDGGKLVHCTVGYRRLTAFRNAATSGQPVQLTFRMNASFPVTGFDWA